MNDLLTIFRDFTPGAYGIWTGVLMLAAYFLREYRETRKLSLDDRLARRDGYAKQVEALSEEARRLRNDLAALEKRHDDYRRQCHVETDQLRDQVVFLENRLAGVLRKVADIAVRVARGEVTADMAAAILQLANDTPPVPPHNNS